MYTRTIDSKPMVVRVALWRVASGCCPAETG
jgi:hypothetical protein